MQERRKENFQRSLKNSGWGGIRTHSQNAVNLSGMGQSGAECGALVAQATPLAPDLAAVVDAWSKLPDAIRAGILAMIRAVQ